MGEIKSSTVAKAAGIIMITTLLSRILGYARDVVIYTNFGQVRETDAYNAAFAIPDFLSLLLMGGAFSAAFIPIFTGYLTKGEREEAWKVASIIFNLAVIFLLVGVTLGMIFTPALIPLVAIGFKDEAETVALTVKMSRIMFAQAFFISLSGVLVGVLNSHKQFAVPAIAGVVYNGGIIAVGWVLAVVFNMQIVGFAIGVVIGAILNFAINLPAVIKLGLRYSFSFDWRHPGVKKIAVLMAPMLISLSVIQLNLIINQNLASTLADGLVSALRAAQRIMQLPIGIFAMSIAIATFPTLSEQVARKDDVGYRHTMNTGIRTVLFVTLPASVAIMALSVPIVRLLFQQGNFTSDATSATAIALFFYGMGIAAYSANQLLNRCFYALQDTSTPVKIGLTTIAVNLGLNLLLIGKLGHGGLALAYSVSGMYSMLALLYFLRRKLGSINGTRLLVSSLQSAGAALIMGIAAYYTSTALESVIDLTNKLHQLVQVSVSLTVAALVYFVIVSALGMEEITIFKGILKRRFKR